MIPVVAGIGNAVMAVPMVRQLKRARPNSKITVIARLDVMAEVFRRVPEVDEVLVTRAGWLRVIWRNVTWTRARRPDVYLVPFPSNRWQYSMLSLLSSAKRVVINDYPVGYWRAMHFLVRDRRPAKQGIHDIAQNLELLRAFDIEPDLSAVPTFPLTPSERMQGEAMLAEANLPPGARPIIIHSGSGPSILAQAKRWPARNYATLIDRLRDELGQHVLLIEGPDEAGVSEEILRHLAKGVPVWHLGGPLANAAALLERAALYLGSDSGLAHLAAAVGTRAVTIFAPADPDRSAPCGNRELVVQAPTPCAPCFLYPWKSAYPKMCCQRPFCIEQVTVDSVLASVRRALGAQLTTSQTISA